MINYFIFDSLFQYLKALNDEYGTCLEWVDFGKYVSYIMSENEDEFSDTLCLLLDSLDEDQVNTAFLILDNVAREYIERFELNNT